jgi:hypothetical protein
VLASLIGLGLTACRPAAPGRAVATATPPDASLKPEMHPRSADEIQVLDADAPPGAVAAPTSRATRSGLPAATVTVAHGQVRLWSTWPMEGRDPQRSSRADVRGPDTNALAVSLDLPEPAFGQVVQAADGTSYVGLQAGGVLAVNSSGGIRWRFTPLVAGPGPTGRFTSARHLFVIGARSRP